MQTIVMISFGYSYILALSIIEESLIVEMRIECRKIGIVNVIKKIKAFSFHEVKFPSF